MTEFGFKRRSLLDSIRAVTPEGDERSPWAQQRQVKIEVASSLLHDHEICTLDQVSCTADCEPSTQNAILPLVYRNYPVKVGSVASAALHTIRLPRRDNEIDAKRLRFLTEEFKESHSILRQVLL
jgi:hypothetical protein